MAGMNLADSSRMTLEGSSELVGDEVHLGVFDTGVGRFIEEDADAQLEGLCRGASVGELQPRGSGAAAHHYRLRRCQLDLGRRRHAGQ